MIKSYGIVTYITASGTVYRKMQRSAFMKFTVVATLFILHHSLSICQTNPVGSALSIQKLQQQLHQINRKSQGLLGVKALCIETGQQVSLHGHHSFPMASTYKIPIGICFLSQVHQGAHKLSDTVLVSSRDLRPGHSPLTQQVLQKGPLRLSKLQLLTRMMHESDNTACDKILELIGGPPIVNNYLTRLGITGMRVDRPEALLTTHSLGVYNLLPGPGWSLEKYDTLINAVPEEERKKALRRFMNDPRDTSTPEAMGQLLEHLHHRTLMDFSAYTLLLKLMTNTTTGTNRLGGLLPPGASLVHKPGTAANADDINGGTNDVGIITTPAGKRHILIAVFLKGSCLDDDARDLVIAQTARAIYDAFAFDK